MDSENRTALYFACLECNLRVVRFLISKNADPRIAHVLDDHHQETPLGCAVHWGYTEVVRRVLGGSFRQIYSWKQMNTAKQILKQSDIFGRGVKIRKSKLFYVKNICNSKILLINEPVCV